MRIRNHHLDDTMTTRHLLETIERTGPAFFTAVCQRQQWDRLETYLRKCLIAKETRNFNLNKLESDPKNPSTLASYFQYLPDNQAIIDSAQHRQICHYFMLMGVKLESQGQSLLPLMDPRVSNTQMQLFLQHCGGKNMLAKALKTFIIERYPRVNRSIAMVNEPNKILKVCEQLCEKPEFCDELDRYLNSTNALRILTNCFYCPGLLQDEFLSEGNELSAQQRLTQLLAKWRQNEPNPVELIMTDLLRCFQTGRDHYREYLSPNHGVTCVWNNAINWFKGAPDESQRVIVDHINPFDTYINDPHSPLLTKIDILLGCVEHKGIAQQFHSKSLWRHIVAAILDQPHVAKRINLSLISEYDKARHVTFCSNYERTELGFSRQAYSYQDTCFSDLIYDCDRQNIDYREAFYNYFTAWLRTLKSSLLNPAEHKDQPDDKLDTIIARIK